MATQTSIETATKVFTQSCRNANDFDRLVQNLSDVLGPSSGLDSADVNLEDIVKLMQQYTSSPSEWERYALSDSSRAYTRNLLDKGNGMSNLLVLVWSPNRGSPIHDHSNAHCVMKVLHGKLKETLYDWPGSECTEPSTTPPRIKKETVYGENEVTYMSDEMGIHRIANPEPDNFAISLHCGLRPGQLVHTTCADQTHLVYTPPHSATHGCHIFDERTGKSSCVKQVAFSEYGLRL